LPAGSDIVQLISTNPLGTMMMVMWIGIGAGLVLSSPIVIYEVWAFISPGLKDKERNAIKPILYGGVLFFLGGVALTYFLLFPVTMDFVVWLDVQDAIRIRPSYTVDEYFSLILNMMWITGLICETPLVVGGLAKLGVVKPSHLTQYWRVCVLGSFILGSIFSPGTDVMSMIVFSVLLLSLYLVSIFMAWLFYPKQKN
jgi:sec-independent protein translocase protein TatC